MKAWSRGQVAQGSSRSTLNREAAKTSIGSTSTHDGCLPARVTPKIMHWQQTDRALSLLASLLLVFGALVSVPQVAQAVSPNELEQLEVLYNNAGGNNWVDKSNWRFDFLSAAPNPCSENWYGITCDGQGQYITKIQLSNNNLDGKIEDILLYKFEFLQVFDVSYNTIRGGFPEFEETGWAGRPGAITHKAGEDTPSGVTTPQLAPPLIEFYVDHNQLTGSIPSLDSLTSLQVFSAGFNQLTGTAPAAPMNLSQGQSSLCPNQLSNTTSTSWDVATGIYPWHSACVTGVPDPDPDPNPNPDPNPDPDPNPNPNPDPNPNPIPDPEPQITNTVDDGFDPGADDEVRALAVQADGRILVGGQFTMIAGESRQRLARLLSDGHIDPNFAQTNVGDAVEAIVVQQDGKVVVGGRFVTVGGQTRMHVARFNSNGSVDSSYSPNIGGDVYALVLQPDGRIVVGGSFAQVNGLVTPGIARLNTDGSVDATFQGAIDGSVSALALQPDGSLVVGGAFAQVNGNARRNLARVRSDGTLDWRFSPEPDGAVSSVVLQPDGSIVAGGSFSVMGGKAFPNLARVRGNGRVDSSFAPRVESPVFAVLQQADGKLVVGGDLTGVGGQPRAHVARINLDGSLDHGFSPGSRGTVRALAQQADGGVLLGGGFDEVASEPRDRLARVYPDGSLDNTLDVAVSAQVEYAGVQPDGRLLLAGVFEQVAGQTEHRLARIWPDGRVDDSFSPVLGGAISANATATLPDGRVLVAGSFEMAGDQLANNVARLNADGSVDTTFTASADSWIKTLTVQVDGKVLIAGNFEHVNDTPRPGLARLNTDGSLDTTFVPATQPIIHSIIPIANGKLLIGGSFTEVGGITRNYLARLNADGSLDPTFDARIAAQQYFAVWAMLLQPDGKVVVGGRFETIAGQTRSGLARLDANGSLDPAFHPAIGQSSRTVLTLAARTDGKLLVGGGYETVAGVARNDLAILNQDGSVDAVWRADTDGFVTTVAVQADGKLLVAGAFNEVSGQVRNNLARAAFPDAALQSLHLTANGTEPGNVTWSRAGTSPELSSPPTLLFSLDGVQFDVEGLMQRQGNAWRYNDWVPPLNQNFWLRTHARTSMGRSNGGLIESTRLAFVGFSDLQVENLSRTSIAGESGWRFDLVNRAPSDADDIVIVTDADTVGRMAFLPVCTTNSANGAVSVRCERPSELGIQCDTVAMGERECSIASLSAGASRTFFVRPADSSEPTIPLTILVNGTVAGQQPLTP